MDLNFELHEKQLEVFKSTARFKVAAAGRRGGKSYVAAVALLVEGMKESIEFDGKTVSLLTKDVWYIAPTFNQGKDIIWALLKELGGMKEQGGLIDSVVENTGVIRLINGRRILVKGSDRPDTLRGVGLSYVVLDEYADMKPEVWDVIVQPTLSDVKGAALFIGTPDGKNHFYEVFKDGMDEAHPEWESFHWTSFDNPALPEGEVASRAATMSESAYRQEFEASFEASGGGSFKQEYLKYCDTAAEFEGDGTFYIAMDPAGFGTGQTMEKSKLARLDEHSIAVVEVGPKGWLIHEIIHGRWGVREACLRLLKACHKYHPAAVGIEKGSLMNAMHDYLEDEMRRLSIYPNVMGLTHGNQKKTERILWALQGRFQKGRIHILKGDWNKPFVQQLMDFPNPLSHDDLVDSVAYIDQLAKIAYLDESFLEDDYEPLDDIAGI